MRSLTVAEQDKANIFMVEQDELVARRQNSDIPYYGASGGAYSYIFTITSLGLMVSIRNNLTKVEVNLTDTSDW
jgi:hypothetical protein